MKLLRHATGRPMAATNFKIPAGFQLSGTACQIKKNGQRDLALIVAPDGADATAVFTQNRLAAAPVLVAKDHLKAARGKIRAVLSNSGNANCATGEAGLSDAHRSCAALAAALNIAPTTVIPASTGVIGVPLPVNRLIDGIPAACAELGATADHARAFAEAIMTTDTRPKMAVAVCRSGGAESAVLGFAKGAGMIHPNMATMLAYVLTDLQATPDQLSQILTPVVRRTFNRISIDGDTSTNDMLIVMASGKSALRLDDPETRQRFESTFEAICADLAEQVVRDGEGVQHLVRLHINGAASEAEAEQIAATIATSPLVKTAWAGADPNWGRILAAIGRSGIELDIDRVDIDFGPLPVCRAGVQVPFDEGAAHAYLSQPEFGITIHLNRGRHAILYLTCDLSSDYVRINADYRS